MFLSPGNTNRNITRTAFENMPLTPLPIIKAAVYFPGSCPARPKTVAWTIPLMAPKVSRMANTSQKDMPGSIVKWASIGMSSIRTASNTKPYYTLILSGNL